MKTNLLLIILSLLFNSFKMYPQNQATPFNQPPEWSKSAIWYQIFVERFYNGDKTNDPTPENMAPVFKTPKGWKISPWTKNWYGLSEWEKKSGKPFDQILSMRRYGGDLQGVIDKLDYLADLGITAIYMNPVNDAPSLHKYDARNYHHVDVNFGPDPVGDNKIIALENPADPATWKWTSADKLFLKLVNEVHKRHMRIILDYSWNHTGTDFWAWKDVLKNQEASPYKDWYDIRSFDNKNTPQNEFSYYGWLNISSLPEIKKVDITTERVSGHPYEGNLNPGAKQHIFEVTKRWLAPDGDISHGIDGYRLDVADQIPMAFWRDYRKLVKTINPEAYLVGEIWWEDYPEKLMNPVPYVSGDVFDAVMFYQAYRPAKYFFSRSNFPINARQLKDSLQFQWNRIKEPFRYAMMNVASTHDSPRLLSCFNNPGKYKYKAKPEDDPAYKTGKPDKETYRRVKLYLLHQFTSIGAPQIWNGEEMGMWGNDDPGCRKPLWWKEFRFESELRFDSKGKAVYTSPVSFNQEHFNYYKKLIRLRKENPVLSSGKLEFIQTEGKTLSYKRFDANNEIFVLLNAGNTLHIFSLPEGHYIDLVTNKAISSESFEVGPLSGVILKKIK
jgi:cyclomaltodextrinase / maltogenic alpha-amylase / neopullulanase